MLKNKIITTTGSMNSIINDVEKKLKYYRLSLYIYSFSSLIEILLLGNYQEEYLFSKKEELDKLDEEYSKIFNETFDYIKNNANKSLEGNFLSGLGSAGKAIGSLAEKTKVKNIDVWINEKSENLKKTGQSIKDNYIAKFDELKNSNSKFFANQIEKMNCIYNKTKEIYFDSEKIYLEIN